MICTSIARKCKIFADDSSAPTRCNWPVGLSSFTRREPFKLDEEFLAIRGRGNRDMTQLAQASTVLELESDLIGQDPEVFKQALLAALVPGQPVVLRAAGVSRAGTVALQLLLAFLREARAKGLAVQLHDASAALRDAVSVAGMDKLLDFAGERREPA